MTVRGRRRRLLLFHGHREPGVCLSEAVNDKGCGHELADDKKEERPAFAKAVLLRAGLEHNSFCMDDFGEDAIVVRRGFDPDELVPDDPGSWYDEPGWIDEYERKIEVL